METKKLFSHMKGDIIMALGTAFALGLVTQVALRYEGAFIGYKIAKKVFKWDKDEFYINEEGEIVYDFAEKEES